VAVPAESEKQRFGQRKVTLDVSRSCRKDGEIKAMYETDLITSLEQLSQVDLEYLIVGSGAAGVAVAERLYQKKKSAKIAVIERGGILTLTHINNIFPNEKRRTFIDKFKITPWEGAFEQGGMLLPALGGRGIAAGAHLRRFDEIDFTLWKNAQWPGSVTKELQQYYEEAEFARRVSMGVLRGPAQIWITGILHEFNPAPPPVGVDLWAEGGFDLSRGYDSSVARLWRVLLEDSIEARSPNRLYVATNSYVKKLIHDGTQIKEVECQDIRTGNKVRLRGEHVILAASTVESARLFLLSDLPHKAAGHYLAEHIERRAKIHVPLPEADHPSQGVSLVVPPRESEGEQGRFQIHLRGQPDPTRNSLQIDIGGFAAMDPNEENSVTLSDVRDEFGIQKARTKLSLSPRDEQRARNMCERIDEIVRRLKGTYITKQFPFEGATPRYVNAEGTIQIMDYGRSYHEAGTLRMGSDTTTSVVDENGRVHGVENLYVSDAALFPCVGVANPMLTITALAYRVADRAYTQAISRTV
jgi:choline dehydrogenase-like flavoprotein